MELNTLPVLQHHRTTLLSNGLLDGSEGPLFEGAITIVEDLVVRKYGGLLQVVNRRDYHAEGGDEVNSKRTVVDEYELVFRRVKRLGEIACEVGTGAAACKSRQKAIRFKG